MLKTIAFVFMFAITACGYAADIFHAGDCKFVIRGEIVSGDDQKFYQVFSAASAHCGNWPRSAISELVDLDSKGGDVGIALAIGRKIREKELSVEVRDGSNCLSACVFILAAGNFKMPTGVIGIHSPFFTSLSASEDSKSVRKKRDSLIQSIKKYLDEIDIPQSLLDNMLSIPPDQMKVLSLDELYAFRLAGQDATFEEMSIAEQAYLFGLSSAEYRKRDANVNSACGRFEPNDGRLACRKTVLLGISIQELRRREERFKKVCSGFIQKKELMACVRATIGLGR